MTKKINPIKIMSYLVNVRIRCRDNLPELKTKGYPVIFKGFRKYNFATHHRISRTDNSWIVTEMSSGLAFSGGYSTRLQAAENAYIQLKTHKEKFIKKVQELQFR